MRLRNIKSCRANTVHSFWMPYVSVHVTAILRLAHNILGMVIVPAPTGGGCPTAQA